MGLMTASLGRPRKVPENERNCLRSSPAGLFQEQVTSCREKNRASYLRQSWKCWPPQNDKIRLRDFCSGGLWSCDKNVRMFERAHAPPCITARRGGCAH